MKKIKHNLVAITLAVSIMATSFLACDNSSSTNTDSTVYPTDPFILALDFFAWVLATPEIAAIGALDANLWQSLIDIGVPFMSPYGPALRTLALTKAPTLNPAPTLPAPGDNVIENNYSQIISFGDSMSDNGNMYKVTYDLTGWGLPMAPNYNGRFSDGPVVLEVMSNFLNRPLINYAFGGGQSGYGGLVPVFGLQIGVLKQVDDFIGNLGYLVPADPAALYVIWTGPDDYYQSINLYLPGVAVSITANVKTAMTKLYNSGARHFFIPTMPDLAITPSARFCETFMPGYLDIARSASADLTTRMNEMLKAFARNHPAATVRTLDAVTYSQNLYLWLAITGVNVTQSCYKPPFMGLTGPVSGPPENYMFWDENHPTAWVSRIIGEAMAYASVADPLPSK